MSANDVSTFATRLRKLRHRAKLSQHALAARAGLTKDAIAHLEQGRRRPRWDTVAALADALGVSCEDFRKQRR
jgi:transcriptional regulator with XRE-family HTH domain